jgi:AraC-like DNA-binding protein
MRETDNRLLEVAKSSAQRFHRGAMGRVLQRYLQLHGARQTYSLGQLELLWQQAAQLDPAIGLHLFEHFTPADWHVLAHLALFSANVGESMRVWQTYARLASDMEQLRVYGHQGRMVIDLSLDMPDALQQYFCEHYLRMSLSLLRTGTGQALIPLSVEFRHPRPTYHGLYTPIFGDNLSFDAAHNRLFLPATTLALPLRQHHPVMAELIREGLDRRLSQLQQFSGWGARLAEQLRRDLQRGLPVGLEQAAQALHQSPRTLRRRLQEQGLGFREILDGVRAELEQSLELQGLSRGQIGEQLGYADLPAYLHARKRWQTPGA